MPVNWDFHCHTNMSDGQLTPDALLDRAVEQKVDHLAITDHDTLAGYDQMSKTNQLKLHVGIEWSTQWNKQGIHVLGFGFDPSHALVRQVIADQLSARRKRLMRIAEKLEQSGASGAISFAQEKLDKGQKGAFGRPDFVPWLLENKYIANERQAWKKWLGKGRPGDVATEWISLEQAIEVTHQAGGIAVLAHPHQYGFTRTKQRKLFNAFFEAGGDGLEVYMPSISIQDRAYLGDVCQHYSKCVSRGSDFHKPGVGLEIGCTPEVSPTSATVLDLIG